jgi:hypothetical protein
MFEHVSPCAHVPPLVPIALVKAFEKPWHDYCKNEKSLIHYSVVNAGFKSLACNEIA